MNRWSPRLYSYISYNVGDEVAARNLIRLILSDVIQAIISTPRIPNLTILIFSVAYRHVLHHLRHTPGYSTTKPQRPLQTHAAESDQGINFLSRFRQMSPEIQQVLLLRYLCGVTVPELVQITGQSEDRLLHVFTWAQNYLP
ncbi:MAG: hypothetical protein R3E79_04600 [Caldilineaceae bacterium]